MFAVAEAVNEVKRQAMTELRKAVAESELKASQLIAAERARLDAVVAEARKQAVDEILLSLRTPHESTEVSGFRTFRTLTFSYPGVS